MHLLYVGLWLAAAVVLAAASGFVFRRVWKNSSRARAFAINLTLFGFSTVFTLLVAEALVYQFAVYSDGYTITLASKRWYDRYWHPINSLGLRGPEPACPPPDGPPVLLVVGDSFTEGAGLQDYHQRFSERLKPLLKERWHVETLAKAGWDTPMETEQLRKFPCTPKRVLLVYYLNDIKSAANAVGGTIGKAPPLSPTLAYMLDRSYLLNLVYYRLYRATGGFFTDVLDPIAAGYANPEAWRQHQREMDGFIAAAKERGAGVDVVIFPDLNNVDRTTPLTEQAQRAFEERGVKVLNLSRLFANREPRSLTVNSVDSHANAGIHAEVAEELVRFFAW